MAQCGLLGRPVDSVVAGGGRRALAAGVHHAAFAGRAALVIFRPW